MSATASFAAKSSVAAWPAPERTAPVVAFVAVHPPHASTTPASWFVTTASQVKV